MHIISRLHFDDLELSFGLLKNSTMAVCEAILVNSIAT